MSVSDVMAVIEKDRNYYERSGGGVTVSGGDPLMQSDFTRELLKACRDAGIHTMPGIHIQYRLENRRRCGQVCRPDHF